MWCVAAAVKDVDHSSAHREHSDHLVDAFFSVIQMIAVIVRQSSG